jgi:hypothetical protein
MDTKNKKPFNKTARSGVIDFTINIQKAENEHRQFSVYQADSSIEAATKMVQNLRLNETLIPYMS